MIGRRDLTVKKKSLQKKVEVQNAFFSFLFLSAILFPFCSLLNIYSLFDRGRKEKQKEKGRCSTVAIRGVYKVKERKKWKRRRNKKNEKETKEKKKEKKEMNRKLGYLYMK